MDEAGKSEPRDAAEARDGRRRHRGGAGNTLPLYKSVKLQVTQALSSGEFRPGAPLPTEKQLAERFGVSIGTIRRAMDDLVAEHIVIRQQGRGTFLAQFSPERFLNRFWPIFRKDGTREIPIVQTMRFGSQAADATVAEGLAIRKGAPTYHIVNLLLMGGNPVLLDDVRIAQSLFPGLTEEEFVSRETTMYGLYQNLYGVSVVRVVDRLTALPASPEVAESLRVPVAMPLLSYTRTAYTFADKPVELRRSYLNTAAYEYRNAIGGDNTPTG